MISPSSPGLSSCTPCPFLIIDRGAFSTLYQKFRPATSAPALGSPEVCPTQLPLCGGTFALPHAPLESPDQRPSVPDKRPTSFFERQSPFQSVPLAFFARGTTRGASLAS